ncbi:MFS transporter [Sphingomonas japonica]|uniref:GPH family glycoside/pentoside/hexuronide:cation symporter n=1 Tax=Sphingomonas japonica TaxID=511662 RepID=A0ABX0U3D2_9SPHN|nr:glycoside-pentoside-hexuronide (GPH):cation symporter [Sphingomonas japonica]NIJ23857.1 GPH family glycoside/pentoside/hexuronide:cation symporter [Sphingomonas japonica]
MATASHESRPGRIEKWAFAGGDFAFNLYWQSVSLYLLYFYTDVVGLPVAWAAGVYAVGLIWDGCVDLGIGIFADRRKGGRGGYRIFLIAGAVPLGLAFVLVYALPWGGTAWSALAIVAVHMLFRSFYAATNVPYSAMTARIATRADDRAEIAGARMLFGTLAGVLVALVTQPLAQRMGGGIGGFAGVAALFAGLACLILLPLGLKARERVGPAITPPKALIGAAGFARNRAFVTLMIAMLSMIVATTVLSKSILYYYKYVIGDGDAAHVGLAAMSIAGGVAIPLWMLAGKRADPRRIWFAASGLSIAALLVFAIANLRSAPAMLAFLIAMQSAIVGFHYAFWAMLPNTVEFGEAATGERREATMFGLAALLQKIAIGASAALFGLLYDAIGYHANMVQAADTIDGMRWIMLAIPIAGLALSALAMAQNPLKRGVHARIVEELGRD